MSKLIKFELDRDGVRALLKSDFIKEAVNDKGRDIERGLNGSYDVNTQVHNRAVARVETADDETFRYNLKTNELLKALSNAKGR